MSDGLLKRAMDKIKADKGQSKSAGKKAAKEVKKAKPKKKETALEKELRLKKEKRAREQKEWDAKQRAKRLKKKAAAQL